MFCVKLDTRNGIFENYKMHWLVETVFDEESNEKVYLVPVKNNIAQINEIATTNATGKFILKLLELPASFDYILKKVIQEYNIEYEKAMLDIKNFLDLCLEKKIIMTIQKDLYIRVKDD